MSSGYPLFMTVPFDDKSQVDAHVASSRAGKSAGRDDTYVGESSPDDDFDAGQTGAEARSEQDG